MHVGHAVPMIIASRFQRMGHQVVFIVGDITAKIGDPSGRTADRPPLTDDDIRSNMATYRDQVTPFFDFTGPTSGTTANGSPRSPCRSSSACWGSCLSPPPCSARTSATGSRRQRPDHGRAGLPVVMALDSVEITADIELGGLDQLLNMQMCRRVMENAGQQPEIIIATGLIEGTDGTGAKMSKSKGNYVGLAVEPKDVFGKLMSAADRLLPSYLRALTELLDPEIDLLMRLMADRKIHPMGVKTLLASDVTAAVHGIGQAEAARTGFTAQFSVKRFSDTPDVPAVTLTENAHATAAELFAKVTRLVPSLGQVRRVAAGGGLRLITEVPGKEQEVTLLTEADATATVGSLLKAHEAVTAQPGARNFLKCGRFLIEIR